jgi:transketolase
MIKKEEIDRLKQVALRCRKDILEMIFAAAEGHEGGSLSAIDLMVALYFWKLKINPRLPNLPNRDRFILSKGHCCPALYACLARRGYFSPSLLKSYSKLGSPLQGTPEYKKCPGIEASAGPLGTGIGVGVGTALAARLDRKSFRTYVMIGDGECDEGNIWESAMAAAHFRLSNLTAILDHNGLQIDGPNSEVMGIEPIADKFRAFGWAVIEIDGHDFIEIADALELADEITDRPAVIIARTVKGKGVSFMEGKTEWHSKPMTQQQLRDAMAELSKDG